MKEHQTKTAILSQGETALVQDGVRNFTVEDIAKTLFISKKTIYKFFPTKDKLIESIVDYIISHVENHFKSTLKKDISPVAKFHELINYVLNQLGRFQLQRMADMKARYPNIWMKIEAFREQCQKDIITVFLEAKSQNLVHAELDLQAASPILLKMINTVFQPEFLIQNNLTPPQAVETYYHMISSGIFTAKGQEELDELRKS